MIFGIAVLGTAVFWILGLPLPFLFGPMAACLIAALAQAPMNGFGQVSVAARTVLGVAVGASITPALFVNLPKMAASIMLVPDFIVLIAQFFIGCAIGVKFVGVTWGELRRIVAYVVVLAILAAGFTAVVTTLELGSPVEAFLAFAPGGQAEMTVLAIVSGADLGFVITHHLTRIVLVIIGAPIAANLVLRWSNPRK
ncbi:AbrB family transcriptional regulator [uncultured Ruegeria sp.]|uniref:AbrB family transcriptional regulator n=1 Tax=uncultured Ruegeria sp. TaxID=259304 RepID=UPI00343E28C1